MTSVRSRNPLAFLDADLDDLRAKGLYRRLRVVESEQAARCRIDGREVITLSSNNYLGLTTHPKLRAAMIAATEELGAGSGAVRTIAGTMTIHQQLEARLAEFKQVEATLTFQSGFTANTGTVPILAGEGAVIVSDELNHASIIDGIRLTKAERKVFPHADTDALRVILREIRAADGGAGRTILVITDGVFSMDGDIAPLPGIVEAAEEMEAIVYVDDAHSSGVLGRNGRGTVDHFDLHGRVHVQVGTLSKAIGVVGGYVAGALSLREVLIHRARPFLFSTSHPPGVAAACLAAIDVLEQEPERIERLWANARRFKDGLGRLGFDTGASETPITPVIAGGGALAMKLSDRLFEEGVFAQGIGFPTVPEAKSRVRTIVTAEHTDEDLDQCIAAFEKVGRELALI
ncbi:MAG TPA: glycine C-acetyltransferase [Candidatus Limnocylindria bacterium]|jgi:glycine C-acetyltransferase|nr:glycine C-acetyltransferase [Candidatus Limnocylindria bacterium]